MMCSLGVLAVVIQDRHDLVDPPGLPTATQKSRWYTSPSVFVICDNHHVAEILEILVGSFKNLLDVAGVPRSFERDEMKTETTEGKVKLNRSHGQRLLQRYTQPELLGYRQGDS